MFSKADNYMNEGCFQSAFLRGKYPYISDLYLQKKFGIFYILYEILRLPFWIKSSMKLHFLVVNLQRSFCMYEYIAKI